MQGPQLWATLLWNGLESWQATRGSPVCPTQEMRVLASTENESAPAENHCVRGSSVLKRVEHPSYGNLCNTRDGTGGVGLRLSCVLPAPAPPVTSEGPHPRPSLACHAGTAAEKARGCGTPCCCASTGSTASCGGYTQARLAPARPPPHGRAGWRGCCGYRCAHLIRLFVRVWLQV
jgi:hypothetical protein